MRALRLLGEGRVVVDEVPEPSPSSTQALVRIEVSALCGSEKPAVRAGSAVNAGHEAAGTVVDAPPGSGLAIGERVGISCITGCGECAACAAGIETRCAKGPVITMGMHADYVAIAPSSLRRLPAGASAELGVLVSGDTLGVPVRAERRVPSRPGMRALIIGLGPVGLAHALVRARAGCEVIGVEPSADRRRLAERLGGKLTVEPGVYAGPPPDLVIEATGIAENITYALDVVAAGGTVLQSGECAAVTINPSATVLHREVTYTGSWFYNTEDYPAMLALVKDGLPIESMVTDTFDASDAQTAFEVFMSTASGKVLLRWTD